MLAGLSQGVGQMAFPVRTCALVGRFADPRVAESLGALLPHLRQRGVTVLVAEDAELDPAMDGVQRMPETEIAERADLVIAIGGDGTLLYAARPGGAPRRAAARRQPRPARLPHRRHAAGHARRRRRGARRAARARRAAAAGGAPARRRAARIAEALALNDVVMQKLETGRMLDFETRVDGRYVNTHARRRHRRRERRPARPPMPSPAAARSSSRICRCWSSRRSAPTPCPTARSWSPARSVVEVTLLERPDTRAQVTCDGAVLGAIDPGDRLEVTTAPRARHAAAPGRPRLLPAAALQAPLGPRQLRALKTMLTHLQIRDFAIIDASRAGAATRAHRAHRRDRRRQVDPGRCAAAAGRRPRRRGGGAPRRRARRDLRHLRARARRRAS